MLEYADLLNSVIVCQLPRRNTKEAILSLCQSWGSKKTKAHKCLPASGKVVASISSPSPPKKKEPKAAESRQLILTY